MTLRLLSDAWSSGKDAVALRTVGQRIKADRDTIMLAAQGIPANDIYMHVPAIDKGTYEEAYKRMTGYTFPEVLQHALSNSVNVLIMIHNVMSSRVICPQMEQLIRTYRETRREFDGVLRVYMTECRDMEGKFPEFLFSFSKRYRTAVSRTTAIRSSMRYDRMLRSVPIREKEESGFVIDDGRARSAIAKLGGLFDHLKKDATEVVLD